MADFLHRTNCDCDRYFIPAISRETVLIRFISSISQTGRFENSQRAQKICIDCSACSSTRALPLHLGRPPGKRALVLPRFRLRFSRTLDLKGVHVALAREIMFGERWSGSHRESKYSFPGGHKFPRRSVSARSVITLSSHGNVTSLCRISSRRMAPIAERNFDRINNVCFQIFSWPNADRCDTTFRCLLISVCRCFSHSLA